MMSRFDPVVRRRVAAGGAVAVLIAALGWTALPPNGEPSYAPAASPLGVTPFPEALPAPAPEAPSPPAPVSAAGLRLHGLLGRGAILSSEGGAQRFVGIGREVRPGVTLIRVEQARVILVSAGAEVSLGFDGKSESLASATPEPGGASPATASGPGATDQRRQQLALRFGLAAQRDSGRITGYRIKAGADLPQLRAAGLRPGDIVIGVNGQTFDSDEKVMELPREIAGAYDAEFEYIRGGKKLVAKMAVNARQ